MRGHQFLHGGRKVNKSGFPKAFAEKYTPLSGWELQTLAFPSGGFASELGSVSCPSASECVADGDYHNSGGLQYLAERWTSTGGWTPEMPTQPAGIGWQALTGLSCPAVTKCISVGEYRVSPYLLSSQRMETEKFTAGAWDYQGVSPNAGVPFAPSSGTVPGMGTVSCVATTECIGVGYYTNTSSALEMMAWKSSTSASSGWEQQSMTALSGETDLHGVYCWSFTTCIAVGRHKPSGGIRLRPGRGTVGDRLSADHLADRDRRERKHPQP
jgi:hypothetical protein